MALPAPSADTAALITGASAGIGIELAREVAARGHNLVLVARRKDKLDELAGELRTDALRVETLDCDLTDPAALDALPGRIESLGLRIDVLVNNAGYGSAGAFERLDGKNESMMVRLNCEAPVALTGVYVGEMVKRGEGAILNVASSAGFQPIPMQATYAATKAFMLNWSDALHAELSPKGVTVTALCPGPVDTEFADVAGLTEAFNKVPEISKVSSEEVARQAVRGVEKGHRNVVPGLAMRVATTAGRFTPRAVLLPTMRKFYRV
jgi:short-subunit dehydrogenase